MSADQSRTPLPSTASDDLSTRLAALSEKAAAIVRRHTFPVNGLYDRSSVEVDREALVEEIALALVPAPTEAARGLAVTEVAHAQSSFRVWFKFSGHEDRGLAAHAYHAGFAAALARTSPPETVGGGALPSQEQMNQAFYVDVCRAEDRLKKFIATARTLLAALPDHWHDDATVNLIDLCDETDAVLNPHMHTPYQVKQAQKSYGADRVVPAALSSAPPAEETWQAPSQDDLKQAYHRLVRGRPVYGGDGGTYTVEVPRQEDFIALVRSLLPPAPAGEAK